MSYLCKGKCENLRLKISNGKRYESGQKFCGICSVFLNLSGARCICCGAMTRTHSRNKGKMN